ncbi:MAG: hypothetical protein EOM19_04665 [Candidatus Moranbacteria bacterium]|nr:hypothetical protein [Candidatus Moranbacteria bacterium]
MLFQNIFDQKNAFKNNIDPFEIFSSSLFLKDSERSLFERIKQMNLSYEKEAPSITNINVMESTLHITGIGSPNSSLLLLIHSKDQKIETLVVDENGYWEFERAWDDFSLLPGKHIAYALSYDEKENIRSQAVFYDFFIDNSEGENSSFLKKYFPFIGVAILLCMFCLAFVPFFRSRLLK